MALLYGGIIICVTRPGWVKGVKTPSIQVFLWHIVLRSWQLVQDYLCIFLLGFRSYTKSMATQYWPGGYRKLSVAYGTCHIQSLRWRYNGHDGVSNHQPHHCLLNRLFRRRSKKTSKLRVTGLSVGNSPGIGEFPAQMASNADNVSIWWRHHGLDDPNTDWGAPNLYRIMDKSHLPSVMTKSPPTFTKS